MINLTETIAILDEIITAAGDGARSTECRYVASKHSDFYREGEISPQCIVGQITYKVGGVSALKMLTEYVNANEGANSALLDSLGFSGESINFLQRLQMEQDKGIYWTEALDEVRPVAV